MTIRYAISIVSTLHIGFRWSLRPPGCFFASPNRVIHEMEKLGLYIQAIPVWGLRINKDNTSRIILSQGPWNAIPSLWAAIRHQVGSLGVPSMWKDWVVSPCLKVCLKMVKAMNDAGIRRVYHHFESGATLVEVHPALDLNAYQIRAICAFREVRLALDLRHLRRLYESWELDEDPTRITELPSRFWRRTSDKHKMIEDWKRVIRVLAPFTDVIHVQPDNGEPLASFISNPHGSETGQLLRYALEEIVKIDPKRELILVAEYNPGIKCLLVPWLSRQLAKKTQKAMESVVIQTVEWLHIPS